MLKKTYDTDIQKIKSSIAKTVEEKRIASNINISTPNVELESMDFETRDINFEILSQQIEQDEQAAKAG